MKRSAEKHVGLPIEPVVDVMRQRHARMQEAADRAQIEADARSPEEQAAFEGGATLNLIDVKTGEIVGVAEGVSDESAAPEGFRFEIPGADRVAKGRVK